MADKSNLSRRELRKEKSLEADRRDILDAASKLFALKGIDQTGMSDIAEESGFSIGKIYKFFPSKKSLFLHIVEVFLERLLNSAEQANDASLPPLVRLKNVFQAAVNIANSDPDRLLIHLHESPSLFVDLKIHIQDIFININYELLKEALEAGHLKPHDPKILAIMLSGSGDALFTHLASSGEKNPFLPIPSLVFDHLILPLMTESSAVTKEKDNE